MSLFLSVVRPGGHDSIVAALAENGGERFRIRRERMVASGATIPT
jgi:hypothetical protein